MLSRRSNRTGPIVSWQNGSTYEYQIDLLLLRILRTSSTRRGGYVLTDFSKYCAIVPIKGKTESDLALGFIDCMNNMGGPPKVIMTDGEGAI